MSMHDEYLQCNIGDIEGDTKRALRKEKFLNLKKTFFRYFYKLKHKIFALHISTYELTNFSNHLNSGRIVVFDTETTGLDVNTVDIIQVAAVELLNGKIQDSIMFYLATDKQIDSSRSIHNITNESLNIKSIDKKEALKKFINFIQDDPLIAHNIKFDINVLNKNLKRIGMQIIYKNKLFCTLKMSKQLFQKMHSYKLSELLTSLNIEGNNSHDALDDTKATANLVLKINKEIETRKYSNEYK